MSDTLSVFLLCLYLIMFLISLMAFLWTLFNNDYNRDYLTSFNIKGFIKGFGFTIIAFILTIVFLRPCIFSLSDNIKYDLSSKPYTTEYLSSRVSINDGYCNFSVYDYKIGIPVNRRMPTKVSTFYYKNIEKPYVEWYKDSSHMMGMTRERTRIKLYLPESWRDN